MKIAAINVGLQGHGHNIAIPPSGIMHVLSGVLYFLPESLRQEVEIKLFDQMILGETAVLQRLSAFKPNALLSSIQISGYYSLALPIFEWAKSCSIPILAGGQHFRVPDIKNGKQIFPGIIARIAAEKRGVFVCFGEGEKTAAAFVRQLLMNGEINPGLIPNLCYWDDKKGLIVTDQEAMPIGSLPYPVLPESVIDIRNYWEKLSGENLIGASGNDHINGIPIGRTMFGPDAVHGCTYRRGRIAAGKQGCRYCALTSACAQVPGKRFWELTKEMLDYVQAIPWKGPQGIRCFHAGDDMGSNLPFIKAIWKAKPEWAQNVPLGHRMYAWFVSMRLARMLYDIGVRWLYIGADGKRGWTSDWSTNHPLVRTLGNCREAGIKTHVSFVLGQRGQSWKKIKKINEFRKKIKAEFGDTIMATDGWVNVVVPGSSDWGIMHRHYPNLTDTDCPDLEAIRLIFWKKFTGLSKGLSPEQVKIRLYEKSAEFEDSPTPKRSWMCRP